MFEESPNKEDQWKSGEDHRRAQRNRKSYEIEHPKIHLQEVAFQRLRTQINRHYSNLRISYLDSPAYKVVLHPPC